MGNGQSTVLNSADGVDFYLLRSGGFFRTAFRFLFASYHYFELSVMVVFFLKFEVKVKIKAFIGHFINYIIIYNPH